MKYTNTDIQNLQRETRDLSNRLEFGTLHDAFINHRLGEDRRRWIDTNDILVKSYTEQLADTGFSLVKTTKRPFGFLISHKDMPEATIQIYVIRRGLTLITKLKWNIPVNIVNLG